MAEEMVVCDGVRRLGLAMGCDGSVSEMGSGFQRWVVRWGLVVCKDEERIFDGVGLDIKWGGFDLRWGVSERKEGFRWVVYDMG
ncbi:unnamed protein product [Prunus armeniaca]